MATPTKKTAAKPASKKTPAKKNTASKALASSSLEVRIAKLEADVKMLKEHNIKHHHSSPISSVNIEGIKEKLHEQYNKNPTLMVVITILVAVIILLLLS